MNQPGDDSFKRRYDEAES